MQHEKDVKVCRDLTKKQMLEEKGMQEEAMRRKKDLKAKKNFIWATVGRQGDRRLVRRFAEKEFASHKRQGQSRQRSSTHLEGESAGQNNSGGEPDEDGKESGERR